MHIVMAKADADPPRNTSLCDTHFKRISYNNSIFQTEGPDDINIIQFEQI